MGDYQTMRLRLWNWGRWGRQNPDAPDGSCRNHLYDMMIERSEGWGDDPPAGTARTQSAGIDAPEIDGPDAEALDCLILQAPKRHRIVLVGVYVLRIGRGSRDDVDAAIRAIWDVAAANRAVVDAMRRA